MESTKVSFRANPTNVKLLDRYLKKQQPQKVDSRSDLLRFLMDKFLIEEGVLPA